MDEIERKYLVAEIPAEIMKKSGAAISQGYLVVTTDREVRVRKKRNRFFLTVKRGRGEVRQETEIALTHTQFRRLWPLTEGRRVEKIRYEWPWRDRIIELDVFSGELTGLVTAEIEFPDKKSAAAFHPPPWFGRDVTEDEHFKNKRLALVGLPNERKPTP